MPFVNESGTSSTRNDYSRLPGMNTRPTACSPTLGPDIRKDVRQKNPQHIGYDLKVVNNSHINELCRTRNC